MPNAPGPADPRLASLLVRLGLAREGEVSRPAALEAVLDRLLALPPETLRARFAAGESPLVACARCGRTALVAGRAGPGECPSCGPEPGTGGAATILGIGAPAPVPESEGPGADRNPTDFPAAVAPTQPGRLLRADTILDTPDAAGDGRDPDTSLFAHDSAQAPTPRPTADAKRPGSSARAAIGTPLGRYLLLQRIGVGGMGVVWKAWDPELGRTVALKQIRKGDDFGPEHIARFQREARLAAKLRHPNIVAVHDVGAVGDEHYLAMEFVEGRTFGDLLDETRPKKHAGDRSGLDRLRDEVRLVAEVAEAVAYAHSQGVIHRDLKPGNVLLDRQDRPYVVDFGLAKEVQKAPDSELAMSNPTLTSAGQVVGTPDYMSPEQAESQLERIGPRSDVWALGIILYECLTGRTPFTAERSWKTLVRVIRDEPARPRKLMSHVPEELEAVCLKAIEKEPEKRYASAEEFAAELRRWLKGEPVTARRYGAGYRAWRWTLRHRPLVGAAAAALALVAWALASQMLVAQARARLLDRLRAAARTAVEGALSVRRMGLLAAMESHRPALDAAYRDAVAELGDSSPEPAHAMGRFARATLKDDEALTWQARALAIDPDHPPSLYEAAVLESRAYATRREKVRDAARAERGALLFGGRTPDPGIANLVPADPSREELEERDPTLRAGKTRFVALLQRLDAVSRSGRAAAAGVGAAQIEAIRALLATQSGRDVYEAYELARPRFASAVAGDPSREEIYHAWAEAAAACGRWQDSIDACTLGLEADRGYLPHLLLRGRARLQIAVEDMMRGREFLAGVEAAVADFGAAVALDPGHARAWSGRGAARMSRAMAEILRGRPSGGILEDAIGDFDRSLALDATDVWAWFGRGNARLNLARATSDAGGDDLPLLEAAVADYTHALVLDSAFVEGWKNRGLARMSLAHAIASRGGDPGAAYRLSLEDFAQAIRRHASDSTAWKFRGMAQRNWASTRKSRGQDSSALLEASLQDLQQALELHAGDAEAWQGLGKTFMNRADLRREAGGDPDPDWDAAIDACTRAVEIHPTLFEAWLTRGNVRMNRGTHRLSRGEDPSPSFADAVADFEKAIALNTIDAGARRSLATLRLNWGAWRMMRDEDPGAHFTAALADLDPALARNPSYAEGWTTRGTIQVNAGLWLEKRGLDPAEPYAEAERDFTRALDLNPQYAEARLNRGRVRMRWARDGADRGADPREGFARALADFEEFLKQSPGHPQARKWRDQLAEWLAQFGAGEAPPDWLGGIRAAEGALREGRWAEAARLYAQALDSAPPPPADPAQMPPVEREARLGAHYNLACVQAQRSVGADPADAAGGRHAPDPAGLREDAFRHLHAAIDLGWKDARHAVQDPDLEPLRGDPRWTQVLDRMR